MAGSHRKGKQVQVEAGKDQALPCERETSSAGKEPFPPASPQHQGEGQAGRPTWATMERLDLQASHAEGQEQEEALQNLPCLAAGHSRGLGHASVHKAGAQSLAES